MVGHLPLALEQAAAVLANSTMTPDDYLADFRGRVERLLSRRRSPDYPVSVAAAWSIGFDGLRASDPTALDLLTLLPAFRS